VSDIKLDIDFDFDFSDEQATAGGGKTYFGRYRLIRIPGHATKEDVSFTIPGLFDYTFDESTQTYLNAGLHTFKKLMKNPNAKTSIFILVNEREQKNGTTHQKILHFISSDKERWGAEQWPALKAIPETYQQKIVKEWVYGQHTEADSTRTFTGNDGNKRHNQYYADFVMYPNRETWQAAKDEFYAKDGSSSTANGAGLDLSNFPGGEWASDNPTTLKESYAALKDTIVKAGTNPFTFIKTAKELSLVNPHGKVVSRINSDEPIDLPALFAEMLDVPVDEEITAAFAGLYKK